MGGSREILGTFDYGSYEYVEFQHMRGLGLKCNDGAGGVWWSNHVCGLLCAVAKTICQVRRSALP